jgi:type II secretory pathway pseudopilin PulG
MNTASPLRSSRRENGFSLLELTVVIAVLLSLTIVATLAARAWKNGADRTGCLLTIRNVQTAVRSYQNIYGYNPGSMPYAEDGSQDIGVHLFTKGYINGKTYDEVQGFSTCGGGGTYSRPHPDVFPAAGECYIKCSLATQEDHTLSSGPEW